VFNPIQLSRVFSNLITKAVKHNPLGFGDKLEEQDIIKNKLIPEPAEGIDIVKPFLC
jgi:hypothetical protein